MRKRVYGALTLVILVLISLVFIGFFVMNVVNRIVTRDARTILSEIASHTAIRFRMSFDDELQTLKTQASFIGTYDNIQDPQVIAILSEGISDRKYLRIGVINPEGWSKNSDDISNNLFYREYFQRAMRGESVVSEVLAYSQDPSIPIIVLAVPISKNSEVVGVLRSVRKVSDYEHMLQTTTVDGGACAFIINKGGFLVFSSCPHTGAKIIPGFTGIEEILSLSPEEIELMISSMKGERGNVFSLTREGRNYYIDYRPLGINDWYLVTSVSDELVMGRVVFILKFAIGLVMALFGSILLFLLIFILLREKRQRIIEHYAFVDALTGLGTWESLVFHSKGKLREWKAKGYWYVLININRFKIFNEIAGFNQGNELLIKVSSILSTFIGHDEYAIRIVNDRFALLLRNIEHEKCVHNIIQSLESLSTDQTHSSKNNLFLSFSCGFYKLQQNDLSIQSIHDRAQIALDEAKKKIETSFCIYDDAMQIQMIQRQSLRQELEIACKEHQFIFYLQPIYDASTLHIIGAEALLRWNHPKRGILTLGAFLHELEESTRIIDVDTAIFESVCRLERSWLDEGLPHMPITVNVSRSHLLNPEFVDSYVSIRSAYQVPSELVELEITETAFTDNSQRMISVFGRLREAGFKISIDDFGSGYSSLSLLKDMEAHTLKIDQHFLRDYQKGGRGEIVIQSIVDLARQLGMLLVAEGVEREDQLQFLQGLKCNAVQGFLFSRPLKVESFMKLWKQSRSFTNPKESSTDL